MPDISEISADIAYVSEWLIKVGDEVKLGDVIVEIETSEATFGIPTTAEGLILHLAKTKKAPVNFDELLCVIGKKNVQKSTINSDKLRNIKSIQNNNVTFEMAIPTLGISIESVEISLWRVQDGQKVEKDDVIAELESDKASFEMLAEANGIIQLHHKMGTTVRVGTKVATIISDGFTDSSESINEEEKVEIEERITSSPERFAEYRAEYLSGKKKENTTHKKSGFLNRLWDFLIS